MTTRSRITLSIGALAAAFALPSAAAGQGAGCRPTGADRPICPAGAPPERAAFVDPSVRIARPRAVRIGERTHFAPFVELVGRGRITIGSETDLQDSVRVVSRRGSRVRIGDRVIIAHNASVRGPARIGVDGGRPSRDAAVFISFGARVDGAIIERNTGVGQLARVGPGVRLPSGSYVLPGKDIDEQRDVRDRTKVRPKVEADAEFAGAVIEVNTALAREDARLIAEDARSLRGIGLDAGGTSFNPARNLPETMASGPARAEVDGDPQAYCNGTPTREPGFRNRILGAVCLEDSVAQLSAVMGRAISLRADEGGPFSVGRISAMGSHTTFHALEETELEVGDDVRYGSRVVVHGGTRQTPEGPRPTAIEDGVRVGSGAIVFASLVGRGAVIGERSAVLSSEIEPGARVPPRTIVLNGEVAGRVEW